MSENNDLLALLEAHGRQFMSSFDSSVLPTKRKETSEAGPSQKRRKQRVEESSDSEEDTGSAAEDEWHGLGESEDSEEDVQEDDDTGPKPDVVIFSDTMTKRDSSSKTLSKAQLKAFMSSKVTKLTQEPPPETRKKADAESDEDDDTTNAQNDALLHRLVHTKILSGSLNPNLKMTPAQRRKALAGRVIEAAGKAKLGKGEGAVRTKEHNRAAKHIRDGIAAKKKERNQKQLEEAKHMGNYHPALKQLFEDDTQAKQPKKRERGLRMGVGSFSGGVLKLSRQEIASATGSNTRKGPRKGGRR